MLRVVAVFFLAGSLSAADPDPKFLAVPPDTAARATALVERLASRDYGERVEATTELRALGRLALPALREAVATITHAEVRARVATLLPAAVAADIQARLACFLADTDGKYQHVLPGGKEFFAATGRTDAAKRLYAAMLSSPNRDLVLAVEGPEAHLRRKLHDRRDDLDLARRDPRTELFTQLDDADVAAILFAESFLPDAGPTTGELGWALVRVRGGRAAQLTGNTLFQSVLESALADDRRREAMAGVVRRWMQTRDHPQTIYTAILAMNRAGLPDALPAARLLAGGKVVGGPVSYKLHAVAYLARHGASDDLPVIEKLFADKTTVVTALPDGPVSRRHTILTSDAALAMALLLTGQNPTDYGLDFRTAYYGSSSDAQKFSPTAYYFDADTEDKADEMRLAALTKYAEWKGKQPKAKK